MRCLVLGGAGFIGSHIVEALLAAGHTVCVLDMQPNPHWPLPPAVQAWWTDWQNTPQLEIALQGVEVVVHLVSTSVPATANHDICADAQANVIGTLRLLDSCLRCQVRKVVYASSGGAVYGVARTLPISEEHPLDPIGAYGVAKLAIEKYLHLYAHLHGLQYSILRGGNPFGERQNPTRPQGAVGVFMGQLARRLPIEIVGDGQIVRDYFYVGDMAQAFRLAVESDLPRSVFNVGSGQGLSLLQLLDEISTVTGLAPDIIYRPARPSDVPTNVLDIARIQHVLGWQPHTPLRVALGRTWDWILQHTP